jgi:putative ABC transport system substrate-binding protein
VNRRPAPSLPGLTRQSILLRKKMDARVKPAHDRSRTSAVALGRREFIALLGGAVAAPSLLWPLAARAQQPVGKTVSIGILAIEAWPPIDTFRQALNDLGYVEAKNVRFEHRYARGRNERFPELANDLVALKVDVILTWGTEAVLAAKQATATIPIVMGAVGDPLGSGIVTNLARPAGNVTGFSSLAAELEAKRLELLKEAVPGLSRVAIVFNPTNRYMPLAVESARQGAQMLRASLSLYEARDTTTLDAALAKLTTDRPDAFMVLADTFLVSQRSRIAQFAIENRLPSAYTYREHVEAGGLLAYTPNYHDLFRRAATYVDKILKGAKPGELPIEQPTKFDLVINLKTAKALGLTVPLTLQAAADEVIE